MEKIKAYGICLYKYNKNSTEVLLCKSVNSSDRWGFLKGVANSNETPEETAIREFYEESGITINSKYLEKFYLQKNDTKDIGIYMVNYNSISNIDIYFNNGILYPKYLSSENSEVRFFDIKKLPPIKKKQNTIAQDIIKYLSKL
ncbi:MAG: NUDIX hydrolase [Arcobacter sp.]|nr:MAG: NUDIX hydrolase [Arcobacter sp.]